MIICWVITCWLMGRGAIIGKETNIMVTEYNDGPLYVCHSLGYSILKIKQIAVDLFPILIHRLSFLMEYIVKKYFM